MDVESGLLLTDRADSLPRGKTMNRRLHGLAGAACVACATAGLLAGTLSPAGAQPAPTTQPEGKPTTIVGCLVDRAPSAGGAAAKGETGTDRYYVRTPTVKIPAGASVAVGTPGTASTATSAGAPAGDSFYRITGLNDETLSPHIGHRVELRGRLSSSVPGKETERPATRQGSDASMAVAGVLHATEIKMVSADCAK